jgi:general secretion pathway protein K
MKSKPHSSVSALTGERGVALIIVLWIFIFLSVVAFEFSAATREEATATLRFDDATQGYYLAVAGFERGLYDFLNQQGNAVAAQREPQKNDLFDGRWREQGLGNGSFRVRLVDESGKINLNRVSEEMLRRIFGNLGIDDARRDILVDSIMDWRDPDDLHRVNGAENDYYASLTPAYTAKNGPLDTVEDLLWIRGVTQELFVGSAGLAEPAARQPAQIALREIFTVDSPIDRVNLRTASAEVLHALMGIPLEKCRAFIEERRKLSENTLTDLLPLLGMGSGDPALKMFIFTNPSVVAVVAEGRPANSPLARRVKGVVRLGRGQGFELLRWSDRDTALPDS